MEWTKTAPTLPGIYYFAFKNKGDYTLNTVEIRDGKSYIWGTNLGGRNPSELKGVWFGPLVITDEFNFPDVPHPAILFNS